MTDFKKERRRQARLERLGTNDPRCGTCGEQDDRVLELHHSAGRRFDDGTVILCRNCHRKASDDQRDHPTLNADEPTLIERVAYLLLGMADLFILLAVQCRKFAAQLFAQLSPEQGASS